MTKLGGAKSIGLGIVGSGRIGTLRARLAAGHSAIKHIAVSDLDPKNAGKLADLVGGTSYGDDNLAVIDDPNVTAVIVSTSEGEPRQCWWKSRSRSRCARPTRCWRR
jgi:predicted dehydrogenase